jgi:hypothetical protein
MSDASDSEHGSPITRKGRLYRKRDVGKENKATMIKYYADPKKREKLKERIKYYTDTIESMKAKVAKLNEYLAAYENIPENAP